MCERDLQLQKCSDEVIEASLDIAFSLLSRTSCIAMT